MKKLICVLLLALPHTAFAADCDSIPGIDAVIHPGTIILLGEIHGTNESPAAVAVIVCRAIDLGLNVNVGLELPDENQARIHRYLNSAGTETDRDSLIAGNFWQRDYQDGRGSKAMIALIESLRQYGRDTSTALRVVAIDGPTDPQGRDWHMANTLRTVLDKDSTAFTIVLTGNVHSRLTMGSNFDPEYEPMGYLLWLQSPEFVIHSLEVTYSGGAAWVDVDGTGSGVQKLGGHEANLGVELYPDAVEVPFTGHLHVGTVSASLPASGR